MWNQFQLMCLNLVNRWKIWHQHLPEHVMMLRFDFILQLQRSYYTVSKGNHHKLLNRCACGRLKLTKHIGRETNCNKRVILDRKYATYWLQCSVILFHSEYNCVFVVKNKLGLVLDALQKKKITEEIYCFVFWKTHFHRVMYLQPCSLVVYGLSLLLHSWTNRSVGIFSDKYGQGQKRKHLRRRTNK